jgi:dehydrogenase/reductase SDR family protein 12
MRLGKALALAQFYLYGRKHFTKSAYDRRAKPYLQNTTPDTHHHLGKQPPSRVVAVTGANQGIGREVARQLAASGAKVFIVCRSRERGARARDEIASQTGNANVHLLVGDCGVAADVRRVAAELAAAVPHLDALVCNAGAMTKELTRTCEGFEVTLATHLAFGSWLLSSELLPLLGKSADPRVIFVSSGGMYATPWPGSAAASWEAPAAAYTAEAAYTYCKRGQVLLAERMSLMHRGVKWVSCHPGWVDTNGVDKWVGRGKIAYAPLRTLWQGAEGIAWLCTTRGQGLEDGGFYLDRHLEPKHLAGAFMSEGTFTKNSADEVDAMMALLRDMSAEA